MSKATARPTRLKASSYLLERSDSIPHSLQSHLSSINAPQIRIPHLPGKPYTCMVLSMEAVMFHPLHEELKKDFRDYFRKEAEIIAKLQRAFELQLFKKFGYPSMFQYCLSEFGVSESRAYLLVGVSKKCSQVPELKTAIESGSLSASQAKRILPVIQKENSQDWIQKAMVLPQRKIEREVARANPLSAVREVIKPIAEDVLEFRCAIDPAVESEIRRCREVMSQKLGKQASWKETLRFMAQGFLERNDPVRRAQRILAKKAPSQKAKVSQPKHDVMSPSKLALRRVPIPAQIKHQVFLRDFGQCQHRAKDGKQCPARQWTEVHHIKEVASGGTNQLENLITLCEFHHDMTHGFIGAKYVRVKVSEAFAPFSFADYPSRVVA